MTHGYEFFEYDYIDLDFDFDFDVDDWIGDIDSEWGEIEDTYDDLFEDMMYG
jgi:hypothetical protein